MKLVYLLDANITSEPLRPEPDAGVTMHLARYGGQFAIPAIVCQELWFGCLRLSASMKHIVVERFLTEVVQRAVPILPYDARAAQWHAAERARLTRLGYFSDGQIAAIAVAIN